jgi:hypothetical protein
MNGDYNFRYGWVFSRIYEFGDYSPFNKMTQRLCALQVTLVP